MEYEQQSIFELLPEEEAKKYRPIKSTDWKWTFADYPKKKNGIKVFSCFACGGEAQWDINWQAATFWAALK